MAKGIGENRLTGFGNTFDSTILKSPLTVGRPSNEPGADVHNNPIAHPKDPLNIIPMDSDRPKGVEKGKK